MSCDQFDKYGEGGLTAEEFARHARDCAECRLQTALDARLDREIAALGKPVDAEGLWERIERSLAHEKEITSARTGKPASGSPKMRMFLSRRWPVLVPAGAALIAFAVLGPRLFRTPAAAPGILAGGALARVEITEKKYLEAIETLERQARPKIEAMDLQELSLYKDKLAVIDAQIGKCREALDSNPANAHIRRYLLAALQDKRQTLTDMLGSANEVIS